MKKFIKDIILIFVIVIAILVLINFTSNAQNTEIGWHQSEKSNTSTYISNSCNNEECYIEFGFEGEIFDADVEFYVYRFDDKDDYKFLYSARYVSLTEQVDNWNIYYTKGYILQKQSIERSSFGLMLQNTTLEAWKEQDSIPTLIKLVEITSDSSENEDYNIFTFEPKILTFPQYDTIQTTYSSISERVIDLNSPNNVVVSPYVTVEAGRQYKIGFNEYNFNMTLNGVTETWPIRVKNKIYVDNKWEYISNKYYTDDTVQLKLIFPEGFTWQDAQDGNLPSVDIWYSKLDYMLNQIVLMRIE